MKRTSLPGIMRLKHTMPILHQHQPVLAASESPAWMGRVDPRLRIVTAILASAVIVFAEQFVVPAAALAAAAIGWAFSGVSPRAALRRLLPLNLILVMMLVLLPLTTRGTTAIEIGPLGFSAEGFRLGAAILLKGNAILLTLLVLTGSMDATIFGHTLSHLHVPDKLTHLLLFTVRYLDLLHREYLRLRWAMKMRAFRPRMDRHTYRTYGYLVGMLLVRSFDRSERIMAAMKCRGFRGRFYMLDHFAFSRHDVPFCIASAGILLLLVGLEWTWPGR